MSEITNAMRQLCEEKGISYDVVLETVESALAAAYRKDFGSRNQNIKIKFNPETGATEVYDVKTVVENLTSEEVAELAKKERETEERRLNPTAFREDRVFEVQKPKLIEGEIEEEKRRFSPRTDIQLSDALLINADAKIDDEVKIELPQPEEYGRMAAQTAKQVIIQKIREAEKNMIMEEFRDRKGEMMNGVIQRYEHGFVLVDLGKTIGVLPKEEQILSERYNAGARIKVYIKDVREGARGPEIILSRAADEIVSAVFANEIPEVANGLIEIRGIAREPGARSKVAVEAIGENLDPVGSCVGQRGSRIQTIINELGGEKIDIITYDENPVIFITNSLSPAKVVDVEINEATKRAVVRVNEDQQSLAIGRGGQNVRLASRLTGWNIDILGADGKELSKEKKPEEQVDEDADEDLIDESEQENGEEKESELQADK